MKYILVSGGVISGVGKGIITSSIGLLLKYCGLEVTAIKIDPYLNIDAGTFSPYEHGEVFVLNDGGEVDLDLGNYERFLDVQLHRDNNITTGKIYKQVIERERRGDYLGKTVQVVPHITDAIQQWIERIALNPVSEAQKTPDICIIELGGTIGDIEGMPFVEAFRQFQFKVGLQNFCNIHVTLVPQPNSTGEQKTKPTQNSIRQLRGLGLSPDIVMCRSQQPLAESVKNKISNFCHVPPEQVICVHDCSSIYHVPALIADQNLVGYLCNRLQLPISVNMDDVLLDWRNLALSYDRFDDQVTIALVGKYTILKDSYISVFKALKHAAFACGRQANIFCVEADHLEPEMKIEDPVKYHKAWEQLCQCSGVLVPGGFGKRGIEGKILAAEWARVNRKPYLGVCLGLQVAVIEFARNVIGWKDAHSTEFEPATTNPVIIDMPEHNPGDLGGTMRLGSRTTIFKTDCETSILRKLYDDKEKVSERHRHRYEVNPTVVSQLEEKGMIFVGHDEEKQRMEIMELRDHPYFVGAQFHPEYLTRPLKPSPPYFGLVLAACGRLSLQKRYHSSSELLDYSQRSQNGTHYFGIHSMNGNHFNDLSSVNS
ncbi:CTP synthase 2 [Trichoplax sp. H2]|nr:CTP synthase 2 [Trichoplax sp. H2]|eukprot:RDD43614.1 CTP synthase 2 [Trichoplax sp. H2]